MTTDSNDLKQKWRIEKLKFETTATYIAVDTINGYQIAEKKEAPGTILNKGRCDPFSYFFCILYRSCVYFLYSV